ncbi:unnamed protein product [Knipowitschia caucasica]|uniref:Distal membrane-arm assembly complex protein 1-like domain-containing protein n=1 Tax=Knipowitschia caucasica TaxID=637954 RepID=A0AAV2KPA1_KNICA
MSAERAHPPPAPVPGPGLFKGCLSCRLLSGGALVLSGAYVFNEARKVMKRGGPTSIGTVAQITFAASIAAWGLVVLTDPVGKSQRKT